MPTKALLIDLLDKWLKEVDVCDGKGGKVRAQIEAFIVKSKDPRYNVINLFLFLTTHLPNHLKAIKAFTDLAIWAFKILDDRESVSNYLWNYVGIIYNLKDLWEHLIPIIPLIALEKPPKAEHHFRTYLNFTKYLTIVYIHQHKNGSVNSSLITTLSKNFSILLQHSAVTKKNSGDFIDCVQDVFEKQFCCHQLIELDKDSGKAFLADLLNTFQLFAKNGEFIDRNMMKKFFILLTDLLENFLSFELRHDVKDHGLSKRLLKIWRDLNLFTNVENECLDILKKMCNVFSGINTNEVDGACEIFQKYCEDLEQHIGADAVIDTFATIALILQKHSGKLQESLSVTAALSIMRAIGTLIRITKGNRKHFCGQCKNSESKKHSIVALISTSLDILKEATKKSENVPTLAFEAALSYIKHLFYILRKLKCPQQNILVQKCIHKVHSIGTVKQVNAQQHILRIIKHLLEVLCKFEKEEEFRKYFVDLLVIKAIENQSGVRETLNIRTLNLLIQIKSKDFSINQMCQKIEKDLLHYLWKLRTYTNTNLIDIIEDDSFEWHGSKVDFDPCQLLLGQILSYESVQSVPLYRCAMDKLLSLSSDPKVLCKAFLYIPCSLYSNYSNELEMLMKNSLQQVECPEKNFHLALVHYIRFIEIMQMRKTALPDEAINENTINELNWTYLDRFSIKDEKNVLMLAINSVRYFEKCDEKFFNEDVKRILKIWTNLAFELKFYGLMKESLKIYDLIYNTATKINHEESIVTATSNIFFYSNIYKEIKCNKAIFNNIAMKLGGLLTEKLSTLHEGDEKYQILIVNCMLNYAVFCAEAGAMDYASTYLRVVLSAIRNLDNKKHLEVLYVCTEYLIMIKYGEKCHISHAHFMNYIMRGIKYFTNNLIIFPLLLEIVHELVEYTVLRHDSYGVNVYIITILKLLARYGYILQVTQILLLYAKVDLVEEKVKNFQAKLYYLLKFLNLDIENGECLEVWRKHISEASSNDEIKWGDIMAIIKLVSNHSHECNCLMCLSSQGGEISLQINFFLIWMLFIENQHLDSELLYKEVFDREKSSTIMTPYAIKSKCLYSTMLQKNGNTEECLSLCESNKKNCKKLKTHRIAIQQTIEAQMISLNYMMNINACEIPKKEFIPDVIPATPPDNAIKSRRGAIVDQVKFQILLNKARKSGSSEEDERSPMEKELDTKFDGRVNGIAVNSLKPPSRRGRTKKTDEAEKVSTTTRTKKIPPPKVEKKSTRTAKKK
ncbi:hypothetical protein DMENIID0001_102800 [Sergentomyia squamirostris]